MPPLTRQEIESHSSNLTNMRISNIMKVVSMAEMEANQAIPASVQNAVAYHSALLTLFYETSPAYDTNVNETELKPQIYNCYKQGERLIMYLKYTPSAKQIFVEQSILNSKKWRFMMHKGLQNLNYFFRFGQHDPKGIKQALELFNESDKTNKKIEVEKNGNKIPRRDE